MHRRMGKPPRFFIDFSGLTQKFQRGSKLIYRLYTLSTSFPPFDFLFIRSVPFPIQLFIDSTLLMIPRTHRIRFTIVPFFIYLYSDSLERHNDSVPYLFTLDFDCSISVAVYHIILFFLRRFSCVMNLRHRKSSHPSCTSFHHPLPSEINCVYSEQYYAPKISYIFRFTMLYHMIQKELVDILQKRSSKLNSRDTGKFAIYKIHQPLLPPSNSGGTCTRHQIPLYSEFTHEIPEIKVKKFISREHISPQHISQRLHRRATPTRAILLARMSFNAQYTSAHNEPMRVEDRSELTESDAIQHCIFLSLPHQCKIDYPNAFLAPSSLLNKRNEDLILVSLEKTGIARINMLYASELSIQVCLPPSIPYIVLKNLQYLDQFSTKSDNLFCYLLRQFCSNRITYRSPRNCPAQSTENNSSYYTEYFCILTTPTLTANLLHITPKLYLYTHILFHKDSRTPTGHILTPISENEVPQFNISPKAYCDRQIAVDNYRHHIATMPIIATEATSQSLDLRQTGLDLNLHTPGLIHIIFNNQHLKSIMFPAPNSHINTNFIMFPAPYIDTVFIQEGQEYTSEDDDELILVPDIETVNVFTAYKRVDKKIHPVSTQFPEDCYVSRQIPEDPLLTLPQLPTHPPKFAPTQKITLERMAMLNINSDGFLSSEEEKLFQFIMVLNEHAIAFEDIERGTLKESYFSPYIIPTVPHSPWEYKNIPIPPGLLPQVLDVLKLKIDAGVYEQSQSSYRSRWFVVLKKNGKLRIVHDLQPLNKVTIRDAGLLPIVDDFVEGFAGHQCYTVFDLFWGFDARKIHPRSRGLTAFMTPLGLLQITSLPTGFTNSPAEFQKCMVMVLKDEIPDTANIFIDDLPIKGPKSQYLLENGNPATIPENDGIRQFIWEHAQDVHRIMHRIACSGATFAANKAQICLPEVLIVGQKCNAEGREPDTKKVDKILTWPNLTTPKEVRQFLGLCGTVRIWIPNYSKIVKPLTELYHIGAEFIWNERRQAAFDQIKQLISTSPALRPIDYTSDRPVILSVDSSRDAAGMILSQIDEEGKRRPARYGSVPMSERESRYSQPKLELFGLYRALRHWRLYIIGVKNLHIEVDAQYIKGMLNEPDLQPSAAVNRWIQGILMFDFKLIHVPAEKHKGPDALSRRPLAEGEEPESDDDSWLDNIALLTLIPDHNFKFTLNAQQYEPDTEINLPSCYAARAQQEDLLRDIKQFLTTLEAPHIPDLQKKRRFLAKAMDFFVKEDKLYKRNGSKPPLLVITEPTNKLTVLTQAHENLGHRGVQAVHETIRHRFFWPHMRADIYHHVRSCHECQIRSLKRMEIPLTVSAPTSLFAKIYIDIMHMPESKGFKYIVAARDDLSGTCEAQALRKATSKELSKFFWNLIYCRYGAPQKVVTDNGPEVKKAFEILLKRLGIPQIKITPYNHHANGVVERGHFTLREAIVKACQGNIKDWPDKIPEAVFADRVTVSRVTGFSPYQLLHGTDPILPLDLAEATFLVDGFRPGLTTSELLALRMRQLEKHESDKVRAAETLRKARFASKAQFEQRFHRRMTKETYEAGELVLVRNSAIESSLDRKHKPRYLGPYQVVGRTEHGAYQLRELDGTNMQTKIAPFRLLPYISRHHSFMRTNRNDPSNANSGTTNSESE